MLQGGDARQRAGGADVQPTVRPEEEDRVGPALPVSNIERHLVHSSLQSVPQQNKFKGSFWFYICIIIFSGCPSPSRERDISGTP